MAVPPESRLIAAAAAWLALGGAVLAQGQADVVERRGFQVIRASGALPPDSPTRLVARIRAGDRTELEVPATVEAGRVQVELLTARRLLPGHYQLEVAAPGPNKPTVLSWTIEHGSPEEVEAALARHLAWLRAASGTVRDLSAALERRARFHLARMEREPDYTAGPGTFTQFVTDSWRPAFLGARMDLETYERRLLLPPLPAASRGLLAAMDLLDERADRWREVLDTKGQALPQPAQILALAEEVTRALDLEPELLQFWTGGLLAAPAPLPADFATSTTYEDSVIGFTLVVPPGFQQDVPGSPFTRFLASRTDRARLLVEVREFPDARSSAELRDALEVANWEGLLSYKRESAEPLRGREGLEIRYEYRVSSLGEGRVVREGLQLALFDVPRRRIVSLLLLLPRGASTPAGLEEGFRLSGSE